MLPREIVLRCLRCAALTPHTVKVVSLPRTLGSMALAAAGGWLLESATSVIGGVILLALAAFVALHEYKRSTGFRCERCRGKARLATRRRKPRLDRHTEVNLL